MLVEFQPQILKVSNGLSVEVKRIEIDYTKESKLIRKLIPTEEVAELGNFLRKRGMSISFTTGVYDMIHNGHVRYLELAATLGDVLVVGLNTDESVTRLKGPNRPILSQEKRAEMLSFLGAVGYIIYFAEKDGSNVIKGLKPDSYLCVEGSWEGDLETKEEVVAMAEVGGKVFYTPRQDPTISTTAVIEKIERQIGDELLAKFATIAQGKINEQ